MPSATAPSSPWRSNTLEKSNPRERTADWKFVNSDSALREECAAYSKSARLAIDTEFVGERTFYPRLELVQLAAGGRIVLVDPQKIRDWSPLAALLANPAIEKVLHAGGVDLPILERATGQFPKPVLDTQIAAAFLGFGYQASLSSLTRELLEVELDGKHTTSDWSQRPLTDAQLAYAADDVRYLEQMAVELERRLDERGRRAWYEEEQRARIEEQSSPEEVDEMLLYRRVKGSNGLAAKELVILRELAVWRDRTARETDTPRRTVFTDDGLVELSQFAPQTKDAMSRLRRVPKGPAMRQAEEIIEVINRARRIPRDHWPQRAAGTRREIPPGVTEIALAVLRDCAERSGVAATLLATTGEVEGLIGATDEERNAERFALLRGWRMELAGKRMLDLLNGRITIRVNREGINIEDHS